MSEMVNSPTMVRKREHKMKSFAGTLVVIDTNNRKGQMIAYQSQLDDDSYMLEEVELFFEEAEIDVSEYDVEKIALELSKRGYSNWDKFHFEIMN